METGLKSITQRADFKKTVMPRPAYYGALSVTALIDIMTLNVDPFDL